MTRVGQGGRRQSATARAARRSRPAVLALVVALALAAACGGNGGNEGQASPTPPPAAGQASPAPTGEAALPASCLALQKLKAYRYVSDVTLESPEPTGTPAPGRPTPTSTLTQPFTGPFEFKYNVDASFVAPDRFEAYITGSTSPLRILLVGGETWLDMGRGWTQSGTPVSIPYRPPEICQAVLAILDLSQVQPQKETTNDVKALHYTFSQIPTQQAMVKIFGSGSDMDVLLRALDVDV
ncbi:MAG: hypothetical protein Q8P22_09425, partial [Chloroflexota bacterium]|nr:hypothetical protein [Chloroflexota bacterium]